MFAALGAVKSTILIVVISAALGYAATLWVRNSALTTDLATKTAESLRFQDANAGLAKQLEEERAEALRVRGIMNTAHTETKVADPIFVERKVYVKEYIKDTTVPKCKLDPKWVSAHDTAATNPYGMSSDDNPFRTGPDPTGPTQVSTPIDDGDVLDVNTDNYEQYYRLKHQYTTLLAICKKPVTTPQ